MRRWLLALLLLGTVLVQGGEFELCLNDQEKYAISEIVITMGEKNIARLLLDSVRLNRLGNSIEHVPPLQFLGFILTKPYLRECLKKISKSVFKWTPFLDGFGTNMDKEYEEGRLFQDLPGFAQLVGGSLGELEEYSYARAWDEFIKCLL